MNTLAVADRQSPELRRERWRWWAGLGLVLVLFLDIWLRGHTIGPAVTEWIGVRLWPVVTGDVEPLDCDEALFGTIGRRLVAGDVMYRDLTDTKPPLGYWLSALAVRIGGANELTIRLMPVPIVLGTIALIWGIGLKLGGPVAAVGAAFIYALASTDPYLYGNGAQFEQVMNLFATAALALMVAHMNRLRRGLVIAVGIALGMGCLVKQVLIVHGVVFAAALLLDRGAPRMRRLGEVLLLGVGIALPWLIAGGILAAQGALADAINDVFNYGRALATNTPPEPGSPPLLVRWFTGNADPLGRLPPPFGRTTYLVWWGGGTWPLWLAAVPALGWLALGSGRVPGRRLTVAWTFSAWVQVALPGLFWAHYYLLPTPGLALAVAALGADALRAARGGRLVGWTPSTMPSASGLCLSGGIGAGLARDERGETPNPKRNPPEARSSEGPPGLVPGSGVWKMPVALVEPGREEGSHDGASPYHPARIRVPWLGRLLGAVMAVLMAAAVGGLIVLQVRDYLLVPAQELTVRFKGGAQWIVLRAMGRELGRRTRDWDDPRLYIWGYESPLAFYSGLDNVTPQVFADNFIRAFADRDHPQSRPRIERTIRDLRARPSDLISTGYPPFAGLRALLMERYARVNVPVLGRELPIWVERSKAEAFKEAPLSPRRVPSRNGSSAPAWQLPTSGRGHGRAPIRPFDAEVLHLR